MTGMPAWGATHEDDALLPVVAFLAKLPNLDSDRYQALLANAKAFGHHTENVINDGYAGLSSDHAVSDTDHDVQEFDGRQPDKSEQRGDTSRPQEEDVHNTHEH